MHFNNLNYGFKNSIFYVKPMFLLCLLWFSFYIFFDFGIIQYRQHFFNTQARSYTQVSHRCNSRQEILNQKSQIKNLESPPISLLLAAKAQRLEVSQKLHIFLRLCESCSLSDLACIIHQFLIDNPERITCLQKNSMPWIVRPRWGRMFAVHASSINI